jgi:potassium channel subfamily K, other eukaryote
MQLIGTTVAIHIHIPPIGPGQIYSQGFWHAVLASIMYCLGSCILIVNLVGYLRGHYPQNFDLDDDQRTLILQTMMFFFWLAGGAAIFSKIEGWTYADALYYADVSILTIGFGDIYPMTDAGRGFLFVFEPLGIIFLGLVISSISRFAANISADKIIKTHQKHARESTVGRTVTNEGELRERLGLPPRRPSSSAVSTTSRRESLNNYGQLQVVGRTVTFTEKKAITRGGGRGGAGRTARRPMSRDEKMRARATAQSSHEKRKHRRQKLLLLREEKDRFDAMREIQEETKKFKQYTALAMALLAFALLWLVGALVFMLTEQRISDLGYFHALYFCFVSLLTIGYGDYSPKSNIGRPFFVVWSLIAVPTMTILIQEVSKTVGASINRGTFRLADFTLLPKKGVFKEFLDHHPSLREWLARLAQRRQERRRIERGFEVQDPDEDAGRRPSRRDSRKPRASDEHQQTLEQLADVDDANTEHNLARQLAIAIKSVAQDLRADPPVRYEYEQWVHFTKLIRFSKRSREEVEAIEEEEGLVEWDWIGEDSPMLADITEAEWVLDRLCESLNRYTKKQANRVSFHLDTRSPCNMAGLTISYQQHSVHRSSSGVTHPPDTIHEDDDCDKDDSEKMTPAVSPDTQASVETDSEKGQAVADSVDDLSDDGVAPDDCVRPRRNPDTGTDEGR